MALVKGTKEWKLWIKRQRESHLGKVPWNKGKTGIYSEEVLDLMKRNRKDTSGKNHPFYGKHHTQITKDKISKTLEGNMPWNIGTGGKGIMRPNKTSFKKGDVSFWKGKHLSKEHVRKVLTRRTPSSLEKKFLEIVDKYRLPYRFVGDGSFFIEQYNPDFINTNSEKIAVEVYASFHKRRLFGSIEKWKDEREAVFNKYGWKIIYFDETEVNEKIVSSKLGRC